MDGDPGKTPKKWGSREDLRGIQRRPSTRLAQHLLPGVATRITREGLVLRRRDEEAHQPLEDFPLLEQVRFDLQRACATSFWEAIRLATACLLVGMPSGAVIVVVADIVGCIQRAFGIPTDSEEWR